MNEEYRIIHYKENGRDFFDEWRNKLRDIRAKIAIDRTLINVEKGNLGVHKPCRSGVWEFIIDYRPGYRIYYSITGKKIILLLCAGDKSSQQKDINKAIEYLRKFKEEN